MANVSIKTYQLISPQLLSVIYMYASLFLNYHFFGHGYWLPQQAPAYFYTALLFLLGLNFLSNKNGFIFKLIAELGKASWHIFLFQMLYFSIIGANKWDSIYMVLINLIICVIFGCIFYLIENTIYIKIDLHKKSQTIS
jgi:peptidoglycan/LPS O-acetylase OafA/YrhL